MRLLTSLILGGASLAHADWATDSWDAIVVGAGPAGIIVADRLSEAGKKTLLIEGGGGSYWITGGRQQPDWLKGTEISRVDGRKLLLLRSIRNLISIRHSSRSLQIHLRRPGESDVPEFHECIRWMHSRRQLSCQRWTFLSASSIRL